MANINGFDASQVPEWDNSPLPEGAYNVIATASEFKPTKRGDGEYLQFTFEVLDGQYRGRNLWARMNLKNPNRQAAEIAQRELAALCKAVGILKPADSAELHNKPLIVAVKIEVDNQRRESNVIVKYEPAVQQQPMYAPPAGAPAQQPAWTAPAGVQPSQPAQQAAPAMHQPQQQPVQQPVQQPAMAAAGGTAPWLR